MNGIRVVAMAKRLRVKFQGELGATRVEESGQAQACASGVGWVNPHTLQTLAKKRIPRTDPWGRPLESEGKK
jgi:hypothetical protein